MQNYQFLFGILLTAQIIICVCMGGLILIQRSEGGALGMGGGPSGFMSARGAGNLLTKATAILAVLFFANSLGLTIVGNLEQHGASAVDQIDTSKLTVSTAPTRAPTGAASSSTSAPSLSDLPMATTPTVQTPAPGQPQSQALPSGPVRMPAPLSSSAPGVAKMPAPLSSTSTSTSASH